MNNKSPISYEELLKKLQLSTVNLVKASNQVPLLGDGFELYATFPDFHNFMGSQKDRIIMVLRKLLQTSGFQVRVNETKLEDMKYLVNVNDSLVERAARVLDEQQAALNKDRIKARQIQLGAEHISSAVAPADCFSASAPAAAFNQPFKDGGGRYAVLSKTFQQKKPYSQFSHLNNGIVSVKPQLEYKLSCFIDNSDATFACKLRFKHNAFDSGELISGQSHPRKGNLRLLVDAGNESETDWLNDQELQQPDEHQMEHPYKMELDNFVPADSHLEIPDKIQIPKPLTETRFVFVDTTDKLELLVRELNSVTEFAFDLEHHAYRSFLGFTCLIQISTRYTDYVVDPFSLFEHIHMLNEPFTNPNIVKVAFDASHDTRWLQRDFGVYVVGLFDAQKAFMKIKALAAAALSDDLLKMKKNNLGALIAEVCGVELDKGYQRADWRIRPLPDHLLEYARNDTHYLLACFDYFKRTLSADAIRDLFAESVQVCLTLFEQPRFSANGYIKLIKGQRMNNRQLNALEQLWRWRDQMAREHDESLHYVLPDHQMLKIAEVLPRETSGILACCVPVPALVLHDQNKLIKMISVARELPMEQKKKETANVFSDMLFLGQQQQKNAVDNVLADPMLEMNRITAKKAKLEYRFDCRGIQQHQNKHGEYGEDDEEGGEAEKHHANAGHDNTRHKQPASFTSIQTTAEKANTMLNCFPIAASRAKEVLYEPCNQLQMDEARGKIRKRSREAAKEEEKGGRPTNRQVSVEMMEDEEDVIEEVKVLDMEEKEDEDNRAERHQQNRKETLQRAKQIRHRIEQNWVSPYDSYLVGVREKRQRQEQQEREQRIANNNTNNDIKPEKSTTILRVTTSSSSRDRQQQTVKRYSHLDDEESDEEVIVLENEVEETASMAMVQEQQMKREEREEDEELDEDDRAFFADPTNLTKKARKRMRKMLRKTVNIPFSNC